MAVVSNCDMGKHRRTSRNLYEHAIVLAPQRGVIIPDVPRSERDSVPLSASKETVVDFDTQISVREVLRDQTRPGFAEPFHKVIFGIDSAGIDPIKIGLWVHRRCPDAELVKVARSFLAGRLADMTASALDEAYSSAQVDALWQKVPPT